MTDKRLAIIVPYRNRKEHLEQFLPHVLLYFDRDKLDKDIRFSIHIVEQAADSKPFNRGKMRNVGFDLTKAEHDYFCFHDVDYLPLWSDYSYTTNPTRLIWWGLQLREDHERFFGGVVAINKADFISANGYSNEYWGWGPEDLEFGMRCDIVGLKREFRDGTFQPLPHKHAGMNEDKSPTPEAARNHALMSARLPCLNMVMKRDGLSSLSYDVKSSEAIPSKSRATVMRHVVAI